MEPASKFPGNSADGIRKDIETSLKEFQSNFIDWWIMDAVEKVRNRPERGDCLARRPYQPPTADLIRETLQ
ncbi:MAG: hypothetical protein GY859_11855 [Desulfobacterales bacterium]|nr:hypothetical protein [Desulfobacterales bacterium]